MAKWGILTIIQSFQEDCTAQYIMEATEIRDMGEYAGFPLSCLPSLFYSSSSKHKVATHNGLHWHFKFHTPNFVPCVETTLKSIPIGAKAIAQ